MAESEDTVEKSVEDLEKEITCAICHEHYTEPKVLPCCHYYCKQCIHRLTLRSGVDKPFSCPECRKDVTLPTGGVDNLPTAFFINRLKATHSNMERAHGKVEARCELCSGDKAIAFCRQCAQFICTLCVQSHQRMKTFTGHKTVSLEELRKGGAKEIATQEPTLQTCQLHKEPMKVYCFDCHCLICLYCSIKKHIQHNYEVISVAAPDIKKKINKQLDPLRDAKVNISRAVIEVESITSDVEAQGQSVASYIESSFKELHQILDNRKQELLAEAAQVVSQKVENLSGQKKSLSTSCAVIQSVIDYTEQCIEHSADDEVLSVHTEIQSRIDREVEEYKRNEKALEPVDGADIAVEVSCDEDLKEICKTIEISRLSVDFDVNGKEKEYAVINKTGDLLVTVKLSNEKPVKRAYPLECHLKTLASNATVKCEVTRVSSDQYRVQYKPTVRGRHELMVTRSGQKVPGSPFPLLVSINPTRLGKPVRVIAEPELNTVRDVAVNSTTNEIIVASGHHLISYDRNSKRLYCYESLDSNAKFCGVAYDSSSNCVYAIGGSNTTKVMKFTSDLKLQQESTICQTPTGVNHSGVVVVKDKVMVCDHEKNALKCTTKT